MEHFVELVADEHDGATLSGHDADGASRRAAHDSSGREHRGGLVEDDDGGIATEALDDLDPLTETGSQVADTARLDR